MKGFKENKKWIYWFTLALAIVIIYKVLDNFTGIGEWVRQLIKSNKTIFNGSINSIFIIHTM